LTHLDRHEDGLVGFEGGHGRSWLVHRTHPMNFWLPVGPGREMRECAPSTAPAAARTSHALRDRPSRRAASSTLLLRPSGSRRLRREVPPSSSIAGTTRGEAAASLASWVGRVTTKSGSL